MKVNLSLKNTNFKSVNKDYLQKVQDYARKKGEAPAEVFFDISQDVFDNKMLASDGLETLEAIKPYVKTAYLKNLFEKTLNSVSMKNLLNKYF